MKSLYNNVYKTSEGKFIVDKKKLVSVSGMKNSRIEFTDAEIRSANYTSNVKVFLQPMFKQYFNIIVASQGERVLRSSPAVTNNVNYTTYIYGVNNYFGLMRSVARHVDFSSPVFFSSINYNVRQYSNQIFLSMTINSQRLHPGNVHELSVNLAQLKKFLEVDEKLNAYCCFMGLYSGDFLTSANKALLCWYNEVYYLNYPTNNAYRNSGAHWRHYKEYMVHETGKKLNPMNYNVGTCAVNIIDKNCGTLHLLHHLLSQMHANDLEADHCGTVLKIVKSYWEFLCSARHYQSVWELFSLLTHYYPQESAQGSEVLSVTVPGFPLVQLDYGSARGALDKPFRTALEKDIGQYISKRKL